MTKLWHFEFMNNFIRSTILPYSLTFRYTKLFYDAILSTRSDRSRLIIIIRSYLGWSFFIKLFRFFLEKTNAIKRNVRVHWRITRRSVVNPCTKKRTIVARRNTTVIIWKRDPRPSVTSTVKHTKSESLSKRRMRILVTSAALAQADMMECKYDLTFFLIILMLRAFQTLSFYLFKLRFVFGQCRI